MSPRTRKWLLFWGPAIAYLALIFALSSIRVVRIPVVKFTMADKVLHAIEYAGLTAVLFRALRFTRRPWLYRWAALVALGLASLYGATDEVHQFYVGRSADAGDWLADTIGAALMAAALLAYTELHPDPPPQWREHGD